MIDLMFAAMLMQAAPDRCNAAGRAAQPLTGCTTWREVSQSGENRGHVDPASVRRDGDRVELMTRTLLGTPVQGRIHSFNTRLQLNCAARTTRALHNVAFDASGRTALEFGADESPLPVAAGSAFAAMLDEYCPR